MTYRVVYWTPDAPLFREALYSWAYYTRGTAEAVMESARLRTPSLRYGVEEIPE